MGRLRCMLVQEGGQMSVELAVLVPVMVVVALIAFNLSRFCMLCATFDRIAPDAVVTYGVSPSGSDARLVGAHEVEQSIERSLGGGNVCDVHVSAETVSREGLSRLGLGPALVRYRCEMSYRPWPSSLTIAGVSMASPVALRHERTLVVDRYRSGVVM